MPARTVVASAARTVAGDSGALQIHAGDALSLLVEVTASSGTGRTLDLTIEWSNDGVDWFGADPVDSFAQITTVAPTRVVERYTVKGSHYRVRWAIAGTTPSFTFEVHELVA
jgi:hypothetical protein